VPNPGGAETKVQEIPRCRANANFANRSSRFTWFERSGGGNSFVLSGPLNIDKLYLMCLPIDHRLNLALGILGTTQLSDIKPYQNNFYTYFYLESADPAWYNAFHV